MVLNRRVDLHAIDATPVDFHTGNDSNKFGFFFCMALSTSEKPSSSEDTYQQSRVVVLVRGRRVLPR